MAKCLILTERITTNVKRMMRELVTRNVEYVCLQPEKIILRGKQITNVDFVINTSENKKVFEFIDSKIKIFNNLDSVTKCNDKWLTYNALLPYNITQPFTSETKDEFSYPFVVKDRRGSLGLRCYLVNNEEELLEAESKMRDLPIYQEFISSSYGICLKAMVIGGEVVCCVHKTADGFISNMSYGCTTIPYEVNEAQRAICKKVAQTLNVDYCGIDLLFGKNNEPIVCEVNANAIVGNIEKVTDFNVMGTYVDYILKSI